MTGILIYGLFACKPCCLVSKVYYPYLFKHRFFSSLSFIWSVKYSPNIRRHHWFIQVTNDKVSFYFRTPKFDIREFIRMRGPLRPLEIWRNRGNRSVKEMRPHLGIDNPKLRHIIAIRTRCILSSRLMTIIKMHESALITAIN